MCKSIPTANSGPVEIAAGPDGALWFAEQLGDRIGRITTDGIIREFTCRDVQLIRTQPQNPLRPGLAPLH